MQMPMTLETVLETLRAHESELRAMGVVHTSVFGSIARGTAHDQSDVDIAIDLDETKKITAFDYARIRRVINEFFDGRADVVIRAALKRLVTVQYEREAIDVF